MRKIAIINQKGGSGKTTTTVNLAATLAEQKRRVLVIDFDPQASCSAWLGCSSESRGLLDVLTSNVHINSIITNTCIDYINTISSSSWLIGLEKTLAHEVGAETVLKTKLKQLDQTAWDYVLIDCPPTLGLLTVNVLNAVDELIVPVESRIMALAGLVQLLNTVDVIKERLNSTLKITGILACRVDSRTKHSKDVVDALRKNFGPLVYQTVIHENIRLAEAPSFNQPITVYAPESTGNRDYQALAQEVIMQEKSTLSRHQKKGIRATPQL